jgi:predicted ATPase
MQVAENLDGLLVLDGAEHLADSLAAPLDEWMARAPRLRVLVTSQVPLGRVGEALYRLGSLPLADAVELFGQRAALADQRFALGAAQAPIAQEICRKLDGNPLALELAAARVPAFGLKALLGHLDDRFRLLKMAARLRRAATWRAAGRIRLELQPAVAAGAACVRSARRLRRQLRAGRRGAKRR